jgi:hypothetical protein
MKKIMMLLLVAVLMLGVSGQAMAAFQEGDLIRVVYNSSANGTGTEYATDLGQFTGGPIINNTDTFSLSSVGATSWSNVNVAYFVMSSTANSGNGAAWISGSATNGGNVNIGQFWAGFNGAASTTLLGYQNASHGANSVSMLQSDPSSYWQNMNVQGFSIGTMGGYVNGNAEQNLAALSTTGYVDQVLYYYGSTPDNTTTGTQVATIRTLANGGTTVTPSVSNAPIPAAAYLFGTGLLGLAGIRRKMAA